MGRVLLTVEARRDVELLPVAIHARVAGIFVRLARWPDVSGAKPMRGALAGHYRIRTGDWRILFRVAGSDVVVVRVGHRSEVYDG
jgi:mRNA interferase RelE/StbE